MQYFCFFMAKCCLSYSEKIIFKIRSTKCFSLLQNNCLLSCYTFLLLRQPCWALILEDFSRLVSLYVNAKSVVKKAPAFNTWVSVCLTYPKSYTLTHCQGNRQVQIPWSSAAFFCIFLFLFFICSDKCLFCIRKSFIKYEVFTNT